MPARLRHRLDALRFQVVPGTTGVTTSPDVLVAVSSAVRDHEVLRFDYARPGLEEDAPAPPRRVEPHHLVTSGGRWYVVAWDLDRDDWRLFRADRMTPRVPTGPRFSPREVPGGDATGYVAARFTGSTSSDRWPCTGTVILRLPAGAVLPFAGDGVVEPMDENSCRYESGSWSWIALAASLGRFDTEVEVVEPPELAAAFGRLAKRNASTAGRG
jgi:predicted DNA-binding transcriptional regulator YafY